MLCVRVLTQAAILVLLTRLLNPPIYGSYAAVASLAIVLGSLPSLGSGYVLMSRATKNAQAAADVWRYAWPLTIGVGLLLLLFYAVAGNYVTHGARLSLSTMLWLGTTELVLTPFTVLLSFSLQAQERVPLSQLVQWLPLGLRAAAVLPCFLVDEPHRLAMFVILQFFASLIGLAAGARITTKYVRLSWTPRLITKSELGQGGSYAAMQLVAYNPTELDKIIAVRALGAHDAGMYTASSRVMAALTIPVIALLMAAQPRLFRHADDGKKNKPLIKTIATLAFCWGTISGIILIVSGPFIPRLFGAAYAESAQLMPWLAITPIFLSLRLAAGNVLVALGRPLERLCFELGGIFLLVVSMFLLTPRFGVLGMIMSVIAAELIMTIVGWQMIRIHIQR
jgi:O-antigen/teichoic acid export membrane protein